MPNSYDTLSLDEQTELQVATHRNLLPDKNVARNSDNWKRLRVTSGAVTDLHAHIDAAQRDALPDSAGEATIERHGAIHHVERKGATAASGVNAGKVRGSNGASWDTDDALVHTSGLRFKPTTSGTVGASLEALVGVVALDVGPKTRLTKGETLVWEVTPSGLETEVELVADLDQGGEDYEPIGEYRARILNRISQPAMGGNANDWRQWAIESSSAIKSAYVYPNRNGLGSVDLAALKGGSGAARLLDAPERAALLAYLNARRPVAAAARVLEVITQALNVETTLIPETGVQFLQDWDDTVPLVVNTWTAGTRTLVFTTARPPSMAAGHRLVVGGTAGIELEIESLSSTDAVVVKDAVGQTPAGAALVYSGGPLVTPVRDAIVALFDVLGPRVGPFGFGDWEGQFRLSRFFETVQTAEGVLDSTPITPLVNVDPTPEAAYPNDTQIRLLIPGNVLVRYA